MKVKYTVNWGVQIAGFEIVSRCKFLSDCSINFLGLLVDNASGNPPTTILSGVSVAMQIGNCKIRHIKR